MQMCANMLRNGFLTFSFLDVDEMTNAIFAEKLSDYFEKVEMKTKKPFLKLLENYMNSLDNIVEGRIDKTPQTKKGVNRASLVPRARKYYESVINVKGEKCLEMHRVIDYSRIMMCLYAAIVKNEYNSIENFNYSISCIQPEKLVDSIVNEQVGIMNAKMNRFDLRDRYSTDACMIVIAVIMMYYMLSNKVQGEYEHG